ncbi:MAG: helix-turn-helix domain-containing protein [Bifidobacteriaceae bacterium]|jgi:excisionase family DNA binding protein|nr:helix-turn-helix domain-containing protein [Bifidobacteriaceae bacterium]
MDAENQARDALARLEPPIGVAALASYLGVPVSAVYNWRSRGLGPRAHRFGKHVKFALSDVEAWLATTREPATGGRL